jgi:hypothetical protein
MCILTKISLDEFVSKNDIEKKITNKSQILKIINSLKYKLNFSDLEYFINILNPFLKKFKIKKSEILSLSEFFCFSCTDEMITPENAYLEIIFFKIFFYFSEKFYINDIENFNFLDKIFLLNIMIDDYKDIPEMISNQMEYF